MNLNNRQNGRPVAGNQRERGSGDRVLHGTRPVSGPIVEEDGSIGCGFRLHKFEVLNWGTFDKQIFSVHPNSQSTLLVGQNGSGKSTLVDALLTLLVRPGVRNFNVAAGAKKRERTERSYFEGAYDRNNEDDGLGIKTQCLRDGRKHYSVILAVFCSGDAQNAFTLAQVLYWTGQAVEKVYCFANDERSIKDDFHGLSSKDGVLRLLKDRDFQATKTFTEYERWFIRATGVKSKAMEVLNQTVAVKDIQRLNEFIRRHMLEPQNWSEKVDRLLAHFTQLNEAHHSLVRVREQSELLEPVAAAGKTYRKCADDLQSAERRLSAVDAFFAQQTVDIFTLELASFRKQYERATARKLSLAREIEQVQESCRGIQNEIEQTGGQRLKEIPHLIKLQHSEAGRKREAGDHYRAALNRAKIDDEVDDASAFEALRDRLPAIIQDVSRQVSEQTAARDTVILKRGEIRRKLTENRSELDGLSKRRENLPEWCVALRGELCGELGLPTKELPFAAELIAVKPDEREWESSIEMVLHGFALSLLVPDRHYHLVSRYVERTRLNVKGRGRRLVYLRVAEQSAPTDGASSHPQSVLRKLDYREGHRLLPWIKAELNGRHDYRCCDTIEEFQECRTRAMTRSRHIKMGTKRHDKDDRERVLDPRNFVLGWDNHAKKKRIAEEIRKLEQQEIEIERDVEQLNRVLQELSERSAALSELDGFSSYDQIDVERHETEIAALEEEKRAIEEQSDAIRHLKKRLGTEQARCETLSKDRDKVVADEGRINDRIKQAERLIDNATSALRKLEGSGELDGHRTVFPELETSFVDAPLTVDDFLERKDAFRQDQERRVSRLRAKLEPERDRLLKSMGRYLRKFPEETDMLPNCDYLDSFLGLRQRIVEEDLPRHEGRFKSRLNEKVTHEIGLFRGALDKERRSIEDKIESLNMSLRRLEYRAGTHIQLQPKPVRDREITEFRQQLRECVEGSFEDTDEANETRFVRIRDLVARLNDESNRRWRDKVTDVRNWFDFAADVIDCHSGERVSSYDDSAGQSGGEKAKLAFTILVAAIAYQYDIDPEQPRNDRFQFVVVDEMFSKVDDPYAEYALELFRQFGLQLLIVAPLDAKARVTQPYVGCYLHVNKRDNRSEVFEMSAREFDETMAREDDEQPQRTLFAANE